MENEEPKIDQTFKYDERRKLLTSTIIKTSKGIISEYVDVFDEQGIKNLYKNTSNNDKRIQRTINQTEKLIETNNDKIKEYEKVLPKLTEEEKKFIETVKKVSKYDKVDQLETQNEQQEERLAELYENLKESKKIKNEIQTKVKFKLE